MNIFGVGGVELLIIVLIALIVAGPKRMLHWAYIVGKWLGQLRVLWSQMMDQLQKEFDEAGVDVKLPKDLPTRGDIQRMASQALRPVAEPMEKAMKEVEAEAKAMDKSYKSTSKALDDSLKKGFITTTNGASRAQMKSESEKPDDKPGFGTWSGSPTQSSDQE